MSTVALTGDSFETAVESPSTQSPGADSGIVLVDFLASWCGPCRSFAPVFEKAAAKHTDVLFGKVDTEAEQALAGAAQISSIPTLMAFRDGILVFRQPGACPRPRSRPSSRRSASSTWTTSGVSGTSSSPRAESVGGSGG